mgnify:CR=1 FL=1
MKASKDNKVYTIDVAQKEYYIAQGYDISDDEGNIVSYGAGKSVSYKEHKELEEKYAELEKKYSAIEKENKKLKKEIEGSK